MGVADPNWLLSSMVQSGAALVALIGGILGARYAGLLGERTVSGARLRELEARVGSARAAHRKTVRERAALGATVALETEAILVRLHGLSEAPDSTSLVTDRRLDELGTTRRALDDHLKRLLPEVTQAFITFSATVTSNPLQERDWDKIALRNHYSGPFEHIWRWVFWTILEREDHRAHQRHVAEADSRGGVFAGASYMPYLPGLEPVVRTQLEEAQRRERLDSLRALVDEQARGEARLMGEHAAALEHANSLGAGQGFGIALGALVYLALSAVVVPLIVMAPGPEALSTASRYWLVGSFISGLVVLFAYLVYFALRLRPRAMSKP